MCRQKDNDVGLHLKLNDSSRDRICNPTLRRRVLYPVELWNLFQSTLTKFQTEIAFRTHSSRRISICSLLLFQLRYAQRGTWTPMNQSSHELKPCASANFAIHAWKCIPNHRQTIGYTRYKKDLPMKTNPDFYLRDTPQHKREDSNPIMSATWPFVVRMKRTSTSTTFN